jgi:hypothetical protein
MVGAHERVGVWHVTGAAEREWESSVAPTTGAGDEAETLDERRQTVLRVLELVFVRRSTTDAELVSDPYRTRGRLRRPTRLS